ncbi:hypothetical protein TRAPUB_4303 [Trametes pubescens]|uniref:Uncharacterized protein n=1 Tax=Trametes pubescens TaxID=154538 RepID=A0A1M2W7B8_TRAPU|nr:hypothetical protein TRAPUB_4303 [Trametes pubescens]
MDSRPDLNWEPYPLHRPQPRSAYLHIVVVEAQSAHHPTPGQSRTCLYTVPILPAAPLEVGQYVHLHLLCANGLNARLPHDLGQVVALPVPVAGRLEGERMRHEEEVEFILKNEIAEARVRNAIIRIRHVPNISARTGLSEALSAKLERLAVGQGGQGPRAPEDVAHPLYPSGAVELAGSSTKDLKWKNPLDTDNWAIPRRKPRMAKTAGIAERSTSRCGAVPSVTNEK